MREKDTAFLRLNEYFLDLKRRHEELFVWRLRHPDYDSAEFGKDWDEWVEYRLPAVNGSTFDPDDLPPSVSDLLTSERFLDVVEVAVIAYQTAYETALKIDGGPL